MAFGLRREPHNCDRPGLHFNSLRHLRPCLCLMQKVGTVIQAEDTVVTTDALSFTAATFWPYRNSD